VMGSGGVVGVALGALAGANRDPTAFPALEFVLGPARTAVEIDLRRESHFGIVAPTINRPRVDGITLGLLLPGKPALQFGHGCPRSSWTMTPRSGAKNVMGKKAE
jgi:hypothetical protein